MKKLLFVFCVITLISCEAKVDIKKNNTKEEKNKTQPMLVDNNIPFPLGNNFSREYLQQNFWKCNYSSAGDSYKYWIILPNNVKPAKVEPTIIEGTGLTNIGMYRVIDEKAFLGVTIYYEDIDNTVSSKDWLISKLKLSEEEIINEAELDLGETKCPVILTKITDEGDTIISRHTAYKSNSAIFYIRTECNLKDYTILAETMQHINSSFGLK